MALDRLILSGNLSTQGRCYVEATVQAIVQKIILNGQHGPYAIAESETLGSITFSLEKTVWSEDQFPERGMVVILSTLRKKRAGWRAMIGRFLTPADEQPQKPAKRSAE
jgi:hypothetical protein